MDGCAQNGGRGVYGAKRIYITTDHISAATLSNQGKEHLRVDKMLNACNQLD